MGSIYMTEADGRFSGSAMLRCRHATTGASRGNGAGRRVVAGTGAETGGKTLWVHWRACKYRRETAATASNGRRFHAGNGSIASAAGRRALKAVHVQRMRAMEEIASVMRSGPAGEVRTTIDTAPGAFASPFSMRAIFQAPQACCSRCRSAAGNVACYIPATWETLCRRF